MCSKSVGMLKCSAKDNCYDKSEGGPRTSSLQTLRENLEKVVEFPAQKPQNRALPLPKIPTQGLCQQF